MTKAICWECGVFKSGSFIPFPNCNADATTEDERLISFFLTDHYHDETELNALHVQIRSGGKKYPISDELREEMRPALAAVSRMLDIKNDPFANQNQKPIKPLANRFVINLIRIALLVFVSPFVSIFVWSIYGNITLFADQLIPFGKIFGQSFYKFRRNYVCLTNVLSPPEDHYFLRMYRETNPDIKIGTIGV